MGCKPLPHCMSHYMPHCMRTTHENSDLFLNGRKEKAEKERGNWVANNERHRVMSASCRDDSLPAKFQAQKKPKQRAAYSLS